MIIVISPAKTLDFESASTIKTYTQAEYLSDSVKLIKDLKKLTPAEISSLMRISDKLGVLNFTRFNEWNPPFTLDNARQALLAFKGDVYTGLKADTFNQRDFSFAQKHLRILSGLYGLLRPLDLIQAYRLEMGTRFKIRSANNLYDFWGDKITKHINFDLQKTKSDCLLNLASNEYFKVIQPEDINANIITPVFKDYKNGKYINISFYVKKVRGLMSSFIIKNKINDVEDIKSFREEGYKFYKSESNANNWVFQRKLTQ